MTTTTTTLAVRVLGAALLLAVVAIAVLAGLERAVPDVLTVLASSCLAGLLGLLAPAPRGEPQQLDATVRLEDGGA